MEIKSTTIQIDSTLKTAHRLWKRYKTTDTRYVEIAGRMGKTTAELNGAYCVLDAEMRGALRR